MRVIVNETKQVINVGVSSGGSGVPGPAGPQGESAYEVAVDNGFVGTEAQWLESLVGEPGPQGDNGASAYVYIAYASDDSGTDFTTTFDPTLDYIAILSTDTEIATPVVGDFTGLWKNYIGGDKFEINTRIAFLGDSITEFGGSTINNEFVYTRGHAWVSTHLLNSYLFTPLGGNQGRGGENTFNITQRIQDVFDLDVKIVVFLIGANDLTGTPVLNDMISNTKLVIDALVAKGIKVFMITTLPLFGIYTLGPVEEQIRLDFNTWIKQQSNITSIDAELLMNNESFFADGIHLNGAGGLALGNLLADTIRPFIYSGYRISDVLTPDNTLIYNLRLNGITGNKVGGSTGDCADNYILDQSEGGGAVVVGSKLNEDYSNQQVLTISGTYSGSNKRIGFLQTYSETIVSGTKLEGFIDYEIVSMNENVLGVYLTVDLYGVESAFIGSYGSLFPFDNTGQFPLGRYTGRINPLVLGQDCVTTVYRALVRFKDDAVDLPVSAVVKIYRMGLRVVPE